MLRALIIAALAVLAAALVVWRPASPLPPAIFVQTVLACPGADTRWAAPATPEAACRRMPFDKVDPQGRLVWVRAWIDVPPALSGSHSGLMVVAAGAASWTAYVNGKAI